MVLSLGSKPTRQQKNALAGTVGTPNTGNEFVTKTDPVLTPKLVLGGTGALGTVVISSPVSMSGEFDYAMVTINPGVTITVPADVLGNGLIIKSTSDIVNSGTIDADGAGLGGGSAGTQAGSVPGGRGKGGGAGAGGGGAGDIAAGGAGGDATITGTGGSGGGASAGVGTAGGAGISLAASYLAKMGYPYATPLPGCGGGGSSPGGMLDGEVGAAGGGFIVLEARGNITEGTLKANGANAPVGGGSNAGGGGGGGGGSIFEFWGGTRTAGTATANGGTGSPGVSGSAQGGAGGAGSVIRLKAA